MQKIYIYIYIYIFSSPNASPQEFQALNKRQFMFINSSRLLDVKSTQFAKCEVPLCRWVVLRP